MGSVPEIKMDGLIEGLTALQPLQVLVTFLTLIALEPFLLVTCYLRLMGYVAVSFKCPYLASVDPACS